MKKYGKFYTLPYHENYKISTKGFIYDNILSELVKPIKVDGKWHVLLNNNMHEIAKLMLNTFIGDLQSNIIYISSPKLYAIMDIKYNLDIEYTDKNTILINEMVFKRIKDFNKYFISNNGILYGEYYNKLIVKSFNHAGYPTVSLIDDNGFRSPRKVHRLVYKTYIGELLDGHIIDHVNGLKYCSDYWNLEQITHRENIIRAYESGLNPTRRWNDSDIEIICDLLENNTPSKVILNKIGLSSYKDYRDLTLLIHNLINGILYVDITSKYNISQYISELNKKDRKLSIDDVKDIKQSLLSDDVIINELAKRYKCSSSTIIKIRDNKTWKNVAI